jgi:GT2 family glycosyltransferase
MPSTPTPDSPPEQVVAWAERRSLARAAGEFVEADRLRSLILDAGWIVTDGPEGWHLEPPAPSVPTEPLDAHDVESLLDRPATADLSVHWVVEGWPEDVVRAIRSFRAQENGREVRYVVADVTGAAPGAFGEDVEVLSLPPGTGWAAACNAGLKRATGRLVFVMDGSVEVDGDVFGPLEAALEDPGLGIAGPFGVVTADLREFDEAPPGPCDAIEGYLMAMRRDVLAHSGLFDEKFRWYRTADIELSFRVKDLGLRTEVVPVPVIRHPHRMWFETDPAERAKWSKRNFYRFLDRWRDRWDLTLAGAPPGDETRQP